MPAANPWDVIPSSQSTTRAQGVPVLGQILLLARENQDRAPSTAPHPEQGAGKSKGNVSDKETQENQDPWREWKGIMKIVVVFEAQ